MSDRTQISGKKARREKARKQAKRKKLLIIAVVAIVVLAVAALITIITIQAARIETYADSGQTLELHPDGTFSAVLFHGARYSGTYEKIEHDGNIAIAFTSGGATVYGEVVNNRLTLPTEWDDGHGHGRVLTKR